jgi:hypothetical protein
MYFNAFLAKTLLAFVAELGVKSYLLFILPLPPLLPLLSLPFLPLFTPSSTFDLNRWTFKNIMKVYLSLLVFIS